MKSKFFLRAGIVLAAVFFSLFLNVQPASALPFGNFGLLISDSAESAAGDELKIFNLINRERAKKGLSDLRWDAELARVARSYSEKMARGNFFSHYEADGSGVADRAKNSKITRWNKIGENLFYCLGVREYDSFAVQNWMKSEMHRRNILDSDYTATGVGLARSREGKIYATQVFIRE